jgi:hypothetical protein
MMEATNLQIVRSILINEWDPIGVRCFDNFDPVSDSEYDSYAVDISRMLAEGATQREVEEYLVWAENNMSIDISMARICRVALLLLKSRIQ